ncbi:MAG: hypothetical protein WC110_11280 [Bacteroidales bacterium]|jgi:hypothetical protein
MNRRTNLFYFLITAAMCLAYKGNAQPREVFMGKVLSDTASFRLLSVPGFSSLHLSDIRESKHFVEIRFHGLSPWHNVNKSPAHFYVVITYDTLWQGQTYYYQYSNDTLSISQKELHKLGKNFNIIRQMKPEFVSSPIPDDADLEEFVSELGYMGFFAYSGEDYKDETIIYKGKFCYDWVVFDAGYNFIEYKVGDRFRIFEISNCHSDKSMNFAKMFYKIFMHGTNRPD